MQQSCTASNQAVDIAGVSGHAQSYKKDRILTECGLASLFIYGFAVFRLLLKQNGIRLVWAVNGRGYHFLQSAQRQDRRTPETKFAKCGSVSLTHDDSPPNKS